MITSLSELYFIFRRFCLLVQANKKISVSYGSSTCRWKPWRWVRFDLILMMRDIFMNSNLNPHTKFTSSSTTTEFNPIQDGFFRGCWQRGRGRGGGGKKYSPPLPKITDTYPAMMKLGSYTLRNEDPKIIWITWNNSWDLLTSAFYTGISKFCYIKKYRHRFHLGTSFLILLNFLESLRIVLINMATIVMSAKMDTPVLLKIKCFF